MRHWLFNILGAASLLFLMATAAFWVRSYWLADSVNLGRGKPGLAWHGSWGRAYRIDSAAGSLAFVADDTFPAGGKLRQGFRWSSGFVQPSWLMGDAQPFMGGTPSRRWGFLGFAWMEYRGFPGLSSHAPSAAEYASPPTLGWRVVVPYWAIALVSGGVVAAWGAGARRRLRDARWQREGRCPKCGYDLRASKARCPECGAIILDAMAKGGAKHTAVTEG